MRSSDPSRKRALATALIVVGAVVSSDAQSPTPPGGGRDPILRFVPATAKFFVSGRSLDEIIRTLDRTNAWPAAAQFPGLGRERGRPGELRRMFAGYLSLRDDASAREASRLRFGLIAPAWSRLGDAVWLVQVPDEAVLDRWYPSRQRRGDGNVLGLRFFHTEDGLLVCVRDRVVAMSRRWGPNSLFEQTMKLMAADAPNTLERAASFQELAAHVPADPLALAYVVVDDSPQRSTEPPTPWWPSVERAAVALFESQGRIDVAVRARLRTPHPKPTLDPAVLDRLLHLPQSSLFAWATTLDFTEVFQIASTSTPGGGVGQMLPLFAGLRTARGEWLVPWPKFGPNLIVCWGQDLSDQGATPQLAVMIECDDEPAVRNLTLRLADNLAQFIHAIDPLADPKALAVRESRHLGVSILHVPFETHAERSRLPFLRLLRNLEPAWTVSEGWITLALTREHLERILDAQRGLVPTLAAVPDIRVTARRSAERTVFATVQPDLATEALQHWLDAQSAGAPSLLEPGWWQAGSDGRQRQLQSRGFVVEAAPQLGMVLVGEVDPAGPAAGKLRGGDWIVGVDGVLLALKEPASDFDMRWAAGKSSLGPMLRVQRDDAAYDVMVPKRAETAMTTIAHIDPANVIRALIDLGRTLQFVSFEAHSTDELHYSARVSVRFSPERISNAASPP